MLEIENKGADKEFLGTNRKKAEVEALVPDKVVSKVNGAKQDKRKHSVMIKDIKT